MVDPFSNTHLKIFKREILEVHDINGRPVTGTPVGPWTNKAENGINTAEKCFPVELNRGKITLL